MARSDDDPPTTRRDPAPSAGKAEAGHKQSFARALAKAEFGRFYWNDELERTLRTALTRPPGKPDKGRR